MINPLHEILLEQAAAHFIAALPVDDKCAGTEQSCFAMTGRHRTELLLHLRAHQCMRSNPAGGL